MENSEQEKSIPEITRETQIAMMKFFLKTSIPRILKEQEKNQPLVFKEEMFINGGKQSS